MISLNEKKKKKKKLVQNKKLLLHNDNFTHGSYKISEHENMPWKTHGRRGIVLRLFDNLEFRECS